MKERPILFCADMVLSILDGRKTETRRLIKGGFVVDEHPDTGQPWPLCPSYYNDGDTEGMPIPCPHGEVGDRLWVREAWQVATGGMVDDLGAAVRYRDSEVRACWMPKDKQLPIGLTFDRWRSPLFMPRWASRITLEITGVRAERLQTITEEGAIAEGVAEKRFEYWTAYDTERESYPSFTADPTGMPGLENIRHHNKLILTAREAYAKLWNELNAKRAPWKSNPWVWVLQFRGVS